MNAPVRLLALGTVPWIYTQALYHALAELMTEDTPDTIILARPQKPYVCVGYHQSLRTVLDQDACRVAGLPIVRRRVGGGATYLDSNQPFYQCIFHHTRLPYRVDEVYARLLRAPVAVLRELGLPADIRDGNEIEINGQRIAGVGGGRIGEAVVVVGNILLDFDFASMAQVWRVPSEDFRHLACEAMQCRITTVWNLLSPSVTAEEIQARLAKAYPLALNRPVVPGSLTEAEQVKVVAMEERLLSEEWLYLHSEDEDEPMRKVKISLDAFVHAEEVTINGTLINGAFFTRNGVIERVLLTGDVSKEKRHLFENSLSGVLLERWREVIKPLAAIPE